MSSPWSFLDTISGALGAILFLFIIVDKGGSPVPLPDNENVPIAYLSLDTLTQELHGFLPDSLKRLKPGERMVIVVDAISPKPIPSPELCTLQHFETKECTLPHTNDDRPRCPRPEDHLNVCPDKSCHKSPRCKDPIAHTKVFCDDAKCEKGKEKVIIDERVFIALPFEVGFMLESKNYSDEIDIQVCKINDCVNGGKKRDKGNGMVWLNYKTSGLSAKTGSETIIIEEKSKMAGTYIIQGRLNRRHSSSVDLKATVATKKEYKIFNKTVPPSDNWTIFGKVTINKQGKISSSN